MSEDVLKLENQICHRLYIASNGLTRLYKPLLKEIDLSYPQYILMMALWENDEVSMGDLAEKTSMDKGFMATLVKRMIDKKLIRVLEDENDKRKKYLQLTQKGKKLKEKALSVPYDLVCQLSDMGKTGQQDLESLKNLLDNLNSSICKALVSK